MTIRQRRPDTSRTIKERAPLQQVLCFLIQSLYLRECLYHLRNTVTGQPLQIIGNEIVRLPIGVAVIVVVIVVKIAFSRFLVLVVPCRNPNFVVVANLCPGFVPRYHIPIRILKNEIIRDDCPDIIQGNKGVRTLKRQTAFRLR